MISLANKILKTTVDLAVDLYDHDPDNWTEVVEKASHDIGLEWAMVFDTNETDFTTIRYWNGVKQFGKKVEALSCGDIAEWASKQNMFVGETKDIPFESEFVPVEKNGYVLFVPEYRSMNLWGAGGIGWDRRPNQEEIVALSRLGKFLLSVVRRKEREDDIRKHVVEGINQLQHLVPA